MDLEIVELDNGLRIAYKQSTATLVSHCGFFIDAGSRDEQSNEIGLAHLLEHMLFKGTSKRNVHQVLNRLEVVGGELNAFTSKDKTCIYSSIVSDYFERAVELLTDVTFSSIFPNKELEKEKKVIYEEIDMYLDTPEEKIFDEFQESFYAKHSLGNNILGSKEGLSQFKQEHLLNFRNQNFLANRIIFSVVSPLPIKKVMRICRKYLEPLKLNKGDINRDRPKIVKPFRKKQKDNFKQAHFLMGYPAYELDHEKRSGLMLLSNILAGPGLNSKLNLVLRERLGYTYGVESSYQSLTDSGNFTVYWSTDPKNEKRSLNAIQKVFEQMRTQPLSTVQLNKYKMQFKGQLIMAEESNSSLMFLIGRSLLDLGVVESLDSVLQKIDKIEPDYLQSVANEVLDPNMESLLVFEPS